MDKVQRRQLGALVLCALSVPAILLFPSLHPAILVAGALLAAVLWYSLSDSAFSDAGSGTAAGILGAAAAAFFLLCLGFVVKITGMSYPTARSSGAFGWILLALAVYSTRDSLAPLLRIGAICFLFLTVIFLVIGAFGIRDVTELYPANILGDRKNYLDAVWLLCPLALFWSENRLPREKTGGWRWGAAALCVLPGLLTWLYLSPAVAVKEPFGFYTMTKSIRVFGIMQRFEPILSAALTAGCFCLMGILAHSIGNICKQIIPKLKNKLRLPAVFALSGAASLLDTWILRMLLVILGVLFWVITPLCTQLAVLCQKRSEKGK